MPTRAARWTCAVFCLVPWFQPLLRGDQPSLPQTPRKPVVDIYHGVKVVDPYRWLEDRDDKAVQRWVKDQNRFTRAYLDRLPHRKAILERLRRLNDTRSIPYDRLTYQDGKLFAQSGAILVTLRSADHPESEKVLVDPETIVGKKSAIIDFYNVSPDSKYVAVSISADGKELGDVYLIDTADGKRLKDVVPRVKSPLGGALAWKSDSSGFYYTRNPPNGRAEQNGQPVRQLVYYHKLGSDARKDPYVFGKDLPAIADNTLDVSADDKYLLVSSSTGWAPEQNTFFLIETATGKARQVGTGAEKITSVRFGPKNDLYLLSNHKAPRGRLLRVPLESLDIARADTAVPQLAGVLHMFLVLENRVLVAERIEGSTRLRIFKDNKEESGVPVQPGFHVIEIVPLENDELLYLTESYFTPPAWHKFKMGDAQARRTKLVTTYPRVDYSDCEVIREQAVSKDGTKVPITILRRKDLKLDSTNPVLLYGYGGYNQILNPEFDPNRRLWLEQGGVYAVAHLRGDGDFGEDWHRAGILTNRQNAFNDFAACARHLIERRYTTSGRLAIEGASNGGTLMGAALTQNPGLFRAVVANVGVYDMLRHELKNGGFDMLEFGTVKDPEQFRALYAYSPYHRVVDSATYPAVLLTTGENDGRVDATDSWKFAARLQASASKRPVLLWTGVEMGHQINSENALTLKADMYAFLFEQLEVPFRGATRP